eukprot:Hpha_TRINITY_DN16307_c2_g4::TRINITY_DN16307_c2_g4_i2::g.59369::m.59369/K05916/hmp, YHB1; nitric oxide dioxygenase
MHDSLKVGDTVQLTAPCGVFTPAKIAPGATAEKPAKVAYLTAGIGMTPALALSRAKELKATAAMHIDSAKERSEDLMWELQSRLEGAKMESAFGQPREKVQQDISAWAKRVVGEHGADSVTFVLCGPPGWMKSSMEALKGAGASKIEYEKFGTGGVSPLPTGVPWNPRRLPVASRS